jgi:hypothetical protein
MSDGKALKSLGLFLTQSAVLIDPPGEFFQQDEHDKDKTPSGQAITAASSGLVNHASSAPAT